MALLEVHRLCKAFDRVVLDGLELAVEPGEFFVVVGPSGIGKTTLLRCIAGLERPQQGRIVIRGADVTRLPPYRRNVALTFESYALYPHLTVFENIASPLRARRLPEAEIRRRVEAVAELLRISHILEHRPGEISGGQKQRTALGRTLVRDPDVFLLDEPISHLDARIRHELRGQFHHLEELRRTATLYVTHDYTEALSLADRIGVLGPPGRLLHVGPPEEVFERPRDLFVARHLGQPPINLFDARLRRENGELRVEAAQAPLRFALTERQGHALAGYNGDTVTVGIRPHHLHLLADGEATAGDAAFEARVEVFEALGASGVLMVRSGALALCLLTGLERAFAPGTPLRLGFAAERALLFSPASGANLVDGG